MTANSRSFSVAVLVFVLLGGVVGPGVAAATPADVGVDNHCSFPVSETDATGTEVTIEEEPSSVVTLSPSAAQTMWEIGAKDKVVGVTKYASYLEGSAAKANISGSGFNAIVQEKVVAQDPDLVLAPNAVGTEVVQSLRERGLTVYFFAPAENLEDIVEKTRLTGELVGACDGAEETATEMEERISVIREAVAGVDRPRVLYEFSNGYTAGNGTFIGEMIETAGGTNVAAAAGIQGYDTINAETVVSQDPQFLIQSTRSPEPPRSDAYNETTAVREGNVVVINVDYLNQPAPRTVDAVREMVKAFHPQAYQDALSTPTPTPTPTPTATETTAAMDDTTTSSTTTMSDDAMDPETTVTTTSSGSGPGLGVTAAGVAIAGVALVSLRRRH